MLKKKRLKKLHNPPRTNNNKSRSRKGKEVEVERRVVEVEAAKQIKMAATKVESRKRLIGRLLKM